LRILLKPFSINSIHGVNLTKSCVGYAQLIKTLCIIVSLLAEIPDVEGMSSPTTCEPNHWRRLITRHCLYGVDLNPLAVHLA